MWTLTVMIRTSELGCDAAFLRRGKRRSVRMKCPTWLAWVRSRTTTLGRLAVRGVPHCYRDLKPSIGDLVLLLAHPTIIDYNTQSALENSTAAISGKRLIRTKNIQLSLSLLELVCRSNNTLDIREIEFQKDHTPRL
jgi:hypothetical protein